MFLAHSVGFGDENSFASVANVRTGCECSLRLGRPGTT